MNTAPVLAFVRQLDVDETELLGLELGLPITRNVFQIYATPTTERTTA